MGKIRLLALAVVLANAGAAQAEWFEAKSDHFIVYTSSKESRARELITRLERFDAAVRKFLRVPSNPTDSANPLTVFEVDNISQVEKLCRTLPGSDKECRNTAGFYEGRVEGSVAFVPRNSGDGSKLSMSPQTILFHEYAHHMMLANDRMVYPAWYVEGFAEFMSTAKEESGDKFGIGLLALHRGYDLLNGPKMAVADLLVAKPSSLNEQMRAVFYARGWLLTHYLTLDPSRAGQLAKYVVAINHGTPNLAAANAAFGDLKKLNRDIEGYMYHKTSYFAFPVADLVIGPITVRQLRPGEVAMMPVRLRSERNVNSETAVAVALDARRVAAQFPDDPAVQDALAEAEFDAENIAEADTAADRALAADPKDSVAMVYKGLVTMRRAATAKDEAAAYKAARIWFVKSSKATPDMAWPLVLFYTTFLEQGETPTENAVAALERGFELVPQDDSVRYKLVYQYIHEDKLAAARVTLLPMAYDPHASSDNQARRLLDVLDSGDKDKIRNFMSVGTITTPSIGNQLTRNLWGQR